MRPVSPTETKSEGITLDQYYIKAHVSELTRLAEQIHAGRRAKAAVSKRGSSAVAPLEAATLAKKPPMHENPFNAAQATRIG
jgi:hypothetical protein